ncbi:MAG: hypothetical protein JKY88_09745 [Pseudomonadales bacterium]|nr:hypothetical protein [Pseudomonadales bacterium]
MKITTKLRLNLAFLIVSCSVILSSCATKPSSIASTVTLCCFDGQYTSFMVTTRNIPEFLVPHIVASFNSAMSIKGFQVLPANADLLIELRYEQDNLSQIRESYDFEERTASGDSLRFLARIVIDVSVKGDNRVVWSGNVERIHNVGPGEFMHTGKASVALFDAFAKVLQDF